jgi:tetratricopeptide (TPR) repeat protein
MPRFVGASEAAAVEQAVDLYTSLDLQYGGGLAGEIARGSLAWATRLFNQEMTDATRQRLRAAVAALADRVAWSNYDMGNFEIAGRLFTLALNTAARSDDRDLRAHILLNLSTQTYDLGNGPDAVEMLHLALGDDRVSSVERANLHSVCARHCGGIGDRQGALRQIGMAEAALGEVDDTEPARWARRVTAEPGHADSALGLALFATGDDARAIERFNAALAGLGPGRVRTALRCRTRLAVLYMRDGSLDAGEAEARHAMAAAGQVRSKRVDDDMNMMVTAAETYGLRQLAHDLRGGLPS